MKLLKILFIYFLLLTFLGQAVATARAREMVDQAGRLVRVPDQPQRVISLMPSITEIVFDLNDGQRLAGATRFSNTPAPARKLPRVGSYVRLDLEKIVRLRPDLCLAARDGNPKYVINRLESLDIPVFTIDPRNLQEIIDSILLLGRIFGSERRAEALAASMRRRLARVAGRVSSTTARPRVFFQIDASPMVSAGSNTFIDKLIHRAGGVNLAAGPQSYPRYSWEDILAMRPEVVLIASMAGGFTAEQLKASWHRWPRIPAVRDNRLFVVEANLFDRPTPRLLDGLEMLVGIIHPELRRFPADRQRQKKNECGKTPGSVSVGQ